MPTEWCDHIPVESTPQSGAGEFFRAANGKKIPNEGQRLVSMMTQEGAVRDMKFIVCPVTKASGSVSQMCRAGHKVVFNPPWDANGSYIQHIDIGEKMWLSEHNGLYVLNTRVAPKHKQTTNMRSKGFQRPVNP